MKPPSKAVVQSKRGRAPAEEEAVSAVRLPHKLTAAIDTWAEQNAMSSRSEAIRRLIELGLAGSPPVRRRNLAAASRALEMAAQQIDKLIDPSTPDAERSTRKRRLLKGPGEFRDIRGDLSKPKR